VTGAPTAALPVSVENPETWNEISRAITERTGLPPVTDLASVLGFVGASIRLVFEAENAQRPDTLRASFAEPVIAQLIRHGGGFIGSTPSAADVNLVGVPGSSGPPAVRLRIRITAANPAGQPSYLEQFWDVQMGGGTVTVGATTCPNCGAPLADGAIVCSYCRADTRSAQNVPLLVVKLERVS
jgi:zinc-ribbon domain